MQRSGMWGYKDSIVKEVLKERPNDLCGILSISICIFCRPCRTFLMVFAFNPAFRFAACGAEISYPFRISLGGVIRNPTFRFPTCRFTLHRAEISCPFGATTIISFIKYEFQCKSSKRTIGGVQLFRTFLISNGTIFILNCIFARL
ncbi:hypothetical protein Barb7_03276 [Bacteroidales bacterium Barb7]|nr:hypothetical protein Barb7_03276 [Bacteroidales bacterium Barb7]